MHESGDPHALRGSLHASSFHLESFHEVLNGLSIPLLDIVDFYGIFDVLLLLHEVFMLLSIRIFRELLKLRIQGVNGSTFSHIQGTAMSSSSVGL
ncbi:hypothetical protein Tco_0653575 [Tanacetum coccineum]|uniref:Uncharacterized protein n=1 Tax=Tanacetum coccineum TaxID=301880 RepID=A0ABQ4X0S9_9ASTR